MYRVLCLLLLVLASISAKNLEVSLNLDPFLNITQPPKILSITLKPNQSYTYTSNYLQPNHNYIPNCQHINGQLTQQKISTFPTPSSSPSSTSTPTSNYNYIYASKYGIVYWLDRGTLRVYRYWEREGKLGYIDQVGFQGQGMGDEGLCAGQIVMTVDQEFLYYFYCRGIVRIEIKRSITAVNVVMNLDEAFYGFRVLSGDGFFAWASYSEGVRIYTVDKNNTLTLTQTLQPTTPQPQKTTSITLTHNPPTVHILQSHTLHIYPRLGSGTFNLSLTLSLSPLCLSCTHRQLLIHQSNIYIQSVENSQEFVSQLQVKEVQGEVLGVGLVRFFKGRRSFVGMGVWGGRLMVVYKHVIDLYEINRDPRTIQYQVNGISTSHFQQIHQLTHLSQNLFLKSTQTSTNLLTLTLTPPTLHCTFPSTLPQPLTLTLPTLCTQPQHTTPHQHYYQSCLTQTVINISVREEKGGYHLLAVLAVGLFGVGVVGVLVVWRRGKIQVIQGIVGEINRVRGRSRDGQVEFVEQKQPTRQVNWNQIQQSYQNQPQPPPHPSNPSNPSQHSSQHSSQHPSQHSPKNPQQLHQQLHEQLQDDDFVQGTERDMVQNN